MNKIFRIFLAVICFYCLFIIKTNASDDQKQTAASTIVDVIVKNIDKLPHKTVAVMDFTDINGKDSEEGKLLAEQITTLLINNSNVKVIERKELDKVMKEQTLNQQGITEGGDQETGKILKADAVISGTIFHNDKNEEINARMIDVITGEIYCAANYQRQFSTDNQEFANLTPEQKVKINQENVNREKLKTTNPELYKVLQIQQAQLMKLKEENPKVFPQVVNKIQRIERVRANRPGVFILATDT